MHLLRLFCWACIALLKPFAGFVEATNPEILTPPSPIAAWRGGATKRSTAAKANSVEWRTYESLAQALQLKLPSSDGKPVPEIRDIVKAFQTLSATSQTFKGLDGAAHETYQRVHGEAHGVDVEVAGRARRSASRAGATADGLGACELCELVAFESSVDTNNCSTDNGALANRQVLLNTTRIVDSTGLNIRILLLYEEFYQGGAGVQHGGIEDLAVEARDAPGTKELQARGRLLIVLGDSAAQDLSQILDVISQPLHHVRLYKGLATKEAASVQPTLFSTAGIVLRELEPFLRTYRASAVHIVGRSLAGGVAALAAAILDGSLPMPGARNSKKRRKKRQPELNQTDVDLDPASNSTDVAPLQGLGKERCSAVTLGAPPSMSANVPAEFVTSILYGDDVVGRASPASLTRLLKRTHRVLKRGNMLGFGRVTDTISLAKDSLKTHAHGSEGEEARLAVPGRAYLIRPRRLSHACSIHEVGAQLKGGREALRAAVLWQLNDILLSKSLWKHHQLESYIQGLDRVQLRGLEDDGESRIE